MINYMKNKFLFSKKTVVTRRASLCSALAVVSAALTLPVV